jgi:hypothetical protein
LVNVHIHQFQPGGAVVDAAALAQFQEQWETYRKLVESGCLAHREVGAILRETLNDVFKSPFSFLDIACGDARLMKAVLRSSSPPPILPGCLSKSISITAISSRR